MCSIFGAIGFDDLRYEPEQLAAFQHAWEMAKWRGKDSWGQVWVDLLSGTRWEYGTGDDERLIAPVGDAFVMLGQRRGEPTTEWVQEKGPEDQGPYLSPSGRWIFTHNGVIANDHEIARAAGTTKDQWPTQIDSYAIGVALDLWGWEPTIRRHLTGSYAILAVDTHSRESAILFATNYKPMFVRHIGKRFALVTSQAEYLRRAVHGASSYYQPERIAEVPCYSYGVINNHGVTLHGSLYELTPGEGNHVAVVCSGGLDSSVVAWHYHRAGNAVTLLHFEYGCKAEQREMRSIIELRNAILDDGGRCDVQFIATNFFQKHTRSALTDVDGKVNHDRGGVEGAELAHEWVPARNLIMMALAMGYCESAGIHRLALGTNLEEGGAYPDNEPEFLNKLQALVPYALKPYHQLSIETPVGSFMKHQIVALGLQEQMPFEVTWSCYEGGTEHCGTCGPCSMRRTAFDMNDALDPVFTYQHNG
jgi:7-cyano-7-deazaguanine synthase